MRGSWVRVSWVGVSWVRERMAAAWRQALKFGIVGLAALVVDIGAFNALRYLGPAGEGALYDRPITAKVLSAILATTFAYAANRWWTFRDRGGNGFLREYALFFLLNAIASGIAVACLGLSHYGLGLDSPLADNISANVIGLAMGTMFRWWSYRRWVFPEAISQTSELTEPDPANVVQGVTGPEALPEAA